MFTWIKRSAWVLVFLTIVIVLWQCGLQWYWQTQLARLQQQSVAQPPLFDEPAVADIKPDNAVLLLSNLSLPAPQLTALPVSESLPQAPKAAIKSTADVEQAKPKFEQSDRREVAESVEVKAADSSSQFIKTNKYEPMQQASTRQTVSEAEVDDVYQQLHSNQSLNIQLAWPQDEGRREQIIEHLYQCTAMQFALLSGSQLTYVSPKRYVEVSQWLRVAQGELSRREQHWLQNKNGTPVRLFAQSIDWNLSQFIARHLNNSRLQSLRANYVLTGSGLTLTNITLNGRPIAGNWLLDGTPINC